MSKQAKDQTESDKALLKGQSNEDESIAEILEDVPEEIKNLVVKVTQHSLRSGPLPSPDEIREYEDILPGAS